MKHRSVQSPTEDLPAENESFFFVALLYGRTVAPRPPPPDVWLENCLASSHHLQRVWPDQFYLVNLLREPLSPQFLGAVISDSSGLILVGCERWDDPFSMIARVPGVAMSAELFQDADGDQFDRIAQGLRASFEGHMNSLDEFLSRLAHHVNAPILVDIATHSQRLRQVHMRASLHARELPPTEETRGHFSSMQMLFSPNTHRLWCARGPSICLHVCMCMRLCVWSFSSDVISSCICLSLSVLSDKKSTLRKTTDT